MRLFEVLKYRQDAKGREVLTYKSAPETGSIPRDDDWFQGVTESSKPGFQKIPLFSRDDISQEQAEELQSLKKQGKRFQPFLPFAWGARIRGKKGKGLDFLDALKGRNEEKITLKNADALINDLAKAAVREFNKNLPAKRYKSIIVTPLPSTKPLAAQFAKAVAQQFQQTGIPTSYDNLFVKNPDFKVGSQLRGGVRGDRDGDGFADRGVTFRDDAYKHMLGNAKGGNEADINKAIDHATNREAEIKKLVMSGKVNDEIATQLDLELQYIPKFLDAVLELDPSQEAKVHQVKSESGFLRRMVYNRFSVNPEASYQKSGQEAEEKNKALIIIADDNFDSKRSVDDAYYTLVENGVADFPATVVGAVAMHHIRDTEGK